MTIKNPILRALLITVLSVTVIFFLTVFTFFIIVIPFILIDAFILLFENIGLINATNSNNPIIFLGGLVLIIAIWLAYFYSAYRVGKSLRNFASNITPDTQQKKVQDYSLDRLTEPIEQLPTAENIQQLISEDGEIPDEALRKSSDRGE